MQLTHAISLQAKGAASQQSSAMPTFALSARAALSTSAAAFVPAAVVATVNAPAAASGSLSSQAKAEADLAKQPEGLPVQAPAPVTAEAATQEAPGKHEVL